MAADALELCSTSKNQSKKPIACCNEKSEEKTTTNNTTHHCSFSIFVSLASYPSRESWCHGEQKLSAAIAHSRASRKSHHDHNTEATRTTTTLFATKIWQHDEVSQGSSAGCLAVAEDSRWICFTFTIFIITASVTCYHWNGGIGGSRSTTKDYYYYYFHNKRHHYHLQSDTSSSRSASHKKQWNTTQEWQKTNRRNSDNYKVLTITTTTTVASFCRSRPRTRFPEIAESQTTVGTVVL